MSGFTEREVPELPPNPYPSVTLTVDGQVFKYSYEYVTNLSPFQITNLVSNNLTVENKLYDSNLIYGKRNHVLVSRPDGVEWRNINMRIMSTALTHGAYFNPCAYTPRIEIEKLLEDIDTRIDGVDTTLNSYGSRLDSLETPP
jgi:hypothetical protein